MALFLHAFVYLAVMLILLTITGNWACRLLVNLIGLKDAMAGATTAPAIAGRYIGALERMVIAAGLVMHSWEAIAAVVALKTIGRFKELDQQLPAEYFLVGSLFSLLWAIVITLTWAAYDQAFGVGVAPYLANLLGAID